MKAKVKRRRAREPYPHQREACQHGDVHDHFGCIMQMRLGKTLVTIWRAKDKNVMCPIVSAPKTVLEAWENELDAEGERFIRGYDMSRKQRLKTARWCITKTPHRYWFLINHEALLACPDLCYMPWDYVVIDEGTVIRNPSSQISKLLTNSFRDVPYRNLLTGLLNPESLLDVFQPMKFLFGIFMGETNFYKWRWANFHKRGFDWVPRKGCRDKIMAEVGRLCFVKTRRQAGIKRKLIYEIRYVDMTPDQKRMYRDVEQTFSFETITGKRVEAWYTLETNTWLSQIAGGHDPKGNVLSESKAREIVTLMKGELSQEKIVIWCRYTNEVTLVSRLLAKAGIKHVCISGQEKLSFEDKKALIRQFRGNNKCRAMVCTEKSAKFGLDFSAADVAVYYSNEWSTEDRAQTLERIFNLAKVKTGLLVIDLCTRFTIDKAVALGVRDKLLTATAFARLIGADIAARRESK